MTSISSKVKELIPEEILEIASDRHESIIKESKKSVVESEHNYKGMVFIIRTDQDIKTVCMSRAYI